MTDEAVQEKPVEKKNPKIVIKKGNIDIKMLRSDLIDVAETPDGINFNFTNGMNLYVIDTDMPLATKNVMTNTANSFDGVNLTFDLGNYQKPVVATPA